MARQTCSSEFKRWWGRYGKKFGCKTDAAEALRYSLMWQAWRTGWRFSRERIIQDAINNAVLGKPRIFAGRPRRVDLERRNGNPPKDAP